MSKNEAVATDTVTEELTNDGNFDTAAVGTTTDTGQFEIGAAEPDPNAEATPGTYAAYGEVDPVREAIYMRQRALELATIPGIHEAKEPIASVLARAEAYRTYMETGITGIVA